jgi:hypothetical protein
MTTQKNARNEAGKAFDALDSIPIPHCCRRASEFYRAHLAQGFDPAAALWLTLAAAILEVARELPGGGRHD